MCARVACPTWSPGPSTFALDVMKASPYVPWRGDDYPRSTRDITDISWDHLGVLKIDVSGDTSETPSISICFPKCVRAVQAIDEGYRLRDIPLGSALIYVAKDSPYLRAFRTNAATTMDNFPLLHWFVVSCNLCVDVISECEPTIVQS